jgi:outer membrane protein OmpA-like peptidoglycan-associated protein
MKAAIVACAFAGVGVADLVWIDGVLIPRALETDTLATAFETTPAATLNTATTKTATRTESETRTAREREPALPDAAAAQGMVRVSFPDAGESQVPASEKDEIAAVVALLSTDPQLRVDVRGHADARGSKRLNQRLSKRRARTVARALIEQGIERKRVRVRWFGEQQPAVVGDHSAAWAANRRAELAWWRPGS